MFIGCAGEGRQTWEGGNEEPSVEGGGVEDNESDEEATVSTGIQLVESMMLFHGVNEDSPARIRARNLTFYILSSWGRGSRAQGQPVFYIHNG